MTKFIFISFFSVYFSIISYGQSTFFEFEPSSDHPFGLPNPDAPPEILDFARLIGECNCKSSTLNADLTWAEPVNMIWRFKYIMNGNAVQDETLKEDGSNSGSIRQYIPDSSKWFVHYYSSAAPSPILRAWAGGKNSNGDIILYNAQKAPNGLDGFYKISFTDINENGFNWIGEWVNETETISQPTWKIECIKSNYSTNKAEKNKILRNIELFSQSYINSDFETLANSYTNDAKIFPTNSDIIIGRNAIKERWSIKNGTKILEHKITPVEIRFLGDYAYDYGYYEGKTLLANGSETSWKGKYVIVWKKVGQDWKIYLDIWNGVK